MVMKTGREWLLVESSKLQDRRHRVTVESAELSDHNVRTSGCRRYRNTEIYQIRMIMQHSGDTCR